MFKQHVFTIGRIESEHRRRTAHPSAGRPHNKKVGERIHGACKRASSCPSHLCPDHTESAALVGMPTTSSIFSPRANNITGRFCPLTYDQLWRFALSVVPSARAGNPNFIDFAELIEAGYLEQRDIDGVYLGSDPSNVDYGAIFGGRRQILDRAAERFAADKPAGFR